MSVGRTAGIRSVLMAALFILPVATEARKPKDDSKARAALAKALDGRAAGTPRHCISALQARSSRVIGTNILFSESSRITWVSETRGQCDADDVRVVRVRGSQYCRGDVVDTIDRHSSIYTGFCVLGDFTPWRKVSPPAR